MDPNYSLCPQHGSSSTTMIYLRAYTSLAAVACFNFTLPKFQESHFNDLMTATSTISQNNHSLFELKVTDSMASMKFSELWSRLNALSSLKLNWNSYGATAPNNTALAWATKTLERANRMNCLPNRIDPSAEDGVVLSFINGERYCDIECFNTGEILAVRHDRPKAPIVWNIQPDLNEINEALESIREFIHA